MTGVARAEHNAAWRLVVAFALALFCWSHRNALQLSGFSDDLGLLAELPQRAAQGTLLADVVTKWIGPLWPGSTMWRPLPYSSFALDAEIWGHAPGGWRITNLLLHLGVATFTGLIAAQLINQRLPAAAAFATMLLVPWVPEVTLWLVGRFDGWATLAVVISLWATTKTLGIDRWLALSLFAAIIAFASKESALVLPLWVVLVALLQGALRPRLTLIVGHLMLAVIYLFWRSKLFAGQALAVYASTPEYNLVPLIGRVAAHLTFPVGLAVLAPIAAIASVLLAPLLIPRAVRVLAGRVMAVGMLMALSVIVAVAVHFATPPGAGEGYRLYYLATVGVALIVAAALKASGKAAVAMLITLMIAMGVWQSQVAAEWTRASRTVDAAARAMTLAATTLAPSEFGLVLMPDLMGHVPVARNAQGALLTLKDGTSPARDFFIVFTPPQLAEWHQLAQEDVISKLTQRATAPARITRHFCFDNRKQTLEDLGYWSPGTLAEWIAKWRDAVAQRCPDLLR